MILDEIINNKEMVQKKIALENDNDLKRIVQNNHDYVIKLSEKMGLKIKYKTSKNKAKLGY